MVDVEKFREYLNRRGLKSASTDSYVRDIVQFCDFLRKSGVTDLGAVTGQETSRYCAHLAQKGLAPVSMQRKLASVKRLFEYLCGMGQARLNPAAGVVIRKKNVSRAIFLNAEQVGRLISMPDTGTLSGIRDKAMFLLIASTGIKVSELIALDAGNLELAEKRLRLMRDGLSVTVSLDDDLCRCLSAYMASRAGDDGVLFLNVCGKRITRQGVWKTLKKYAVSAGLEGVTLETLRRSFARRYLNEGHDMRSLQEILGHSDISVTRAYVKS